MRPAPPKKGGDQALGRSRGGLATKIHAACVDEISSVGLILSPGQSAYCSRFDELFACLDKDNVLEAAALDKGYDSNAIRKRLAKDGINPVIPPKSNRNETIPHDREIGLQRNRVERFFNRHDGGIEFFAFIEDCNNAHRSPTQFEEKFHSLN